MVLIVINGFQGVVIGAKSSRVLVTMGSSVILGLLVVLGLTVQNKSTVLKLSQQRSQYIPFLHDCLSRP